MLKGLNTDAREAIIVREILAGNFPEHLRRLVPVHLAFRDPVTGKNATATVSVMPDYLAVGSDSDFLTVPLTPNAAQAIADRFGYCLPTPKIVDAVYRSAGLRLAPQPFPPGPAMVEVSTFARHNERIDRFRRAKRRGTLVAGHKKDVVLTARLWSQPDRVAIYGWHRFGGSPIQPLSLVHGRHYVDYSHGIRLVSSAVSLGTRLTSMRDVLASSKYAIVLSYEGPTPSRYQSAALAAVTTQR